jgi:hypothetical protein
LHITHRDSLVLFHDPALHDGNVVTHRDVAASHDVPAPQSFVSTGHIVFASSSNKVQQHKRLAMLVFPMHVAIGVES